MIDAWESEHDAFGKLTHHLGEAVAAVRTIAQHRPDQRDAYLQLAQTLSVTKEACLRLAGSGVRGHG